MATAVWRWLITIVGLIMTMLVTGIVAYSQLGAGDSGLFASSDRPDFHYHLAVTPGGPAERAGLRTGDIVDPREVPPLTRMRLEGASRSGERSFVVAHCGTQIVHATVIPTPKNSSTWLLTSIAFLDALRSSATNGASAFARLAMDEHRAGSTHFAGGDRAARRGTFL